VEENRKNANQLQSVPINHLTKKQPELAPSLATGTKEMSKATNSLTSSKPNSRPDQVTSKPRKEDKFNNKASNKNQTSDLLVTSAVTSNDTLSITSSYFDNNPLDIPQEKSQNPQNDLPNFYWFQRSAIDAALKEIKNIVPDINGCFLFIELMQMVYEADSNVDFKQCLLDFVDRVVQVATSNTQPHINHH
jgi:hypothetical protein